MKRFWDYIFGALWMGVLFCWMVNAWQHFLPDGPWAIAPTVIVSFAEGMTRGLTDTRGDYR